MENGGGTKVDQFDDIGGGHDAVVKFEVAVRKPDRMQIFDAVTYLTEYAVDLGAAHFTRHDNAEEVKRGIFHDLVVMSMIRNNVHSLNNVRMLQRRANTELRSHFLLILLLALSSPFRTEFLDSEDVSAILVAGFNETHSTTSTRSEDTAPFTIFLGEMCMRRFGKGDDGMTAIRMRRCNTARWMY